MTATKINKNLSEAYFGKNNANIQKMEELFDYCIKTASRPEYEVVTQSSTGYLGKKFSNTITQIEKIIEKEFGFKNVAIDFTPGVDGYNAFTLVQPYSQKLKLDKVVKTPLGVKYIDSDCTATILISNAFLMGEFTGGELTAILLHEIGHNFFSNGNVAYLAVSAVADIIDTVNVWEATKINVDILKKKGKFSEKINTDLAAAIFASVPKALDATGALQKISNKILKNVKKDQNIKKGVDLLATGLKGSIVGKQLELLTKNLEFVYRAIEKNDTEALKLFFTPYLPLNLTTASNMTRLPLSYEDEKFADNFTSAYGYGAELSTAMSKLNTSRKNGTLRKIPLIGQIQDILYTPNKLLYTMLDPHPDTYSRIVNQRKYLEEEMSRLTNEKAKANLKQDIKKIKNLEENYFKNTTKDLAKNGFIGSLMIEIVLYVMRGNPIHRLLTPFTKLLTRANKKNGGDWKQFQRAEEKKSIF